MPFPKLKNIPLYCACGTSENVVHEYNDDGLATLVAKSVHEELPPPEFYDLGNLIKNKVPLQEVNSKVLGKNKLTLTIPEQTKSEQTKSEQTNNEVNDEN